MVGLVILAVASALSPLFSIWFIALQCNSGIIKLVSYDNSAWSGNRENTKDDTYYFVLYC